MSDAASPAGPIAPSDRIAAIDSARGIALFGVMAINVATMFRVSIFERFLPVGVMFGKLGVAAALAIGTGVYILQAVVSRLWLQRFLYGPVEWLWRSAMYGRRQPMWRT